MVNGMWYIAPNICYINIRILQHMGSGIRLVLGLGTRMSGRYVYVVFYGPMQLTQSFGLVPQRSAIRVKDLEA